MTVAELINELKEYPSDLPVKVYGIVEGHCGRFELEDMKRLETYRVDLAEGPHIRIVGYDW